jgi:hypothetical protein
MLLPLAVSFFSFETSMAFTLTLANYSVSFRPGVESDLKLES